MSDRAVPARLGCAIAAACLTAAIGAVAAGASSPRIGCGTNTERASTIVFRAADGTRLVGVLIGKPKAPAVVLGHEFRSNLCEWLPTARVLARSGYRVLAFNFRDNGSGGRIDDDMLGALRAVRSRGSTHVFLVGASMGGTAAMIAATRVTVAPAGVVSLSGPIEFQSLNVRTVLGNLQLPILLYAASGDSPFIDDAQALLTELPSADKTLRVVAGSAHGVGILAGPRGASARRELLRFLTAH